MTDTEQRHLAHLRRRNLRPSTIYQRQRVLTRLGRTLGRKTILRATTADLEAHLDKISDPASRACEQSHLRGFYRWALDTGHITRDPTLGLASIRRRKMLPRPMPTADLRRALDGAPERVRPWLHLAAFAGLRACEIAALRVEHVQWEEGVILIAEGKGGGMSSVPLHPELADVLAVSLPRSGWAFARRDGQPGPLKAHNVSHGANGYLHSIGIAHTLHTLRHWYVTNVYKACRDLRRTQRLARHDSPVSTAGYTWLDPGEDAAVVGTLRVA